MADGPVSWHVLCRMEGCKGDKERDMMGIYLGTRSWLNRRRFQWTTEQNLNKTESIQVDNWERTLYTEGASEKEALKQIPI